MRFLIGFLLLVPAAIGQNQSLFGFLPNNGQFPPAVRFVRYSAGAGSLGTFFYLTRDTFVLMNDVRMQLVGIDPNVQPVGTAPTTTSYNFYQGNNPAQWTTNVHAFAGATLANAYPGINVRWSTTFFTEGPGEGEVIFTIAPGADPAPIRLAVLNTGTTPFLGPGGVWFGGGRIPGTFIVSAQATQPFAGSSANTPCNLVIDSDGTLSLQLPDRNSALETDVTVEFPDYDLSIRPPQAGLQASYLEYPTNWNEDGTISNPGCAATCQKALVANIDGNGNPVWVTALSGSGTDQATIAMADQSGIAVSGSTTSADFPVSPAAPNVKPGSTTDVWLAYLDAATGHWLDGTYAGLPGPAYPSRQVEDAGGDVVVCGADGTKGFLLRWQPAQNRFVYSVAIDALPYSLLLDVNSNLYFAAASGSGVPGAITVGELDPTGKTVGSMALISLPSGTQANSILLQPTPGGILWVAYATFPVSGAGGPSTWLARATLANGQVPQNTRVTQAGAPQQIGLTPLGNVKLLVGGPSPNEPTTPDAPMVGECPSTSYFAVFSPAAQLVYATYVPGTGFNFTAQNESTGPPPAAVACFAATAGYFPTFYAAPGELITIIGGGFGPSTPMLVAPSGGAYPLTAGGFNVKIGGMDAPVLAVARSEVTVQVPYEASSSLGGSPQALSVQLYQNGQPLNSITMTVTPYAFSVFDTGDRNNSLSLPALAALNQDGMVNSATNPAAVGTIVSLFGSGLGVLSPPLATSALNPVPPAGLLSTTSLYRACYGCTNVLYLGSAPGLSTGVQQVNVQLPISVPGTGVRPFGVGVGVSPTVQGLFVPGPSGVVFVQ